MRRCPPPTQTTPSSVSEIAAVAEGRASEKPKTTKATSDASRRCPPTIQEMSPASAPSSVRIRPDVASEHDRSQAASHRVELVECHQAADERDGEEPPAAEPDDAEDQRQQDERDRDPRPEGAHRPPNRRSRDGERRERVAEVIGAEVGPERVGEDELGVGRLPEHEVRDPELARGADQEVDLGQLRRIEARRERLPRRSRRP